MKNGRYVEYGNVCWYKDDRLHREDGPAFESPNGYKAWHANGEYHRLDGPAVEGADGSKAWWVNGKRHRLDGPAIEWSDGTRKWWVDGQEVDIIAIFGYEPTIPLTEEQQLILRLSV